MGMGVVVGVSVGRGVNVCDGMAEAVSVGMEVNVSATGRLVDVLTGAAEEVEAGACPVLLNPQASVVRIRMMGRKYFLFCMF